LSNLADLNSFSGIIPIKDPNTIGASAVPTANNAAYNIPQKTAFSATQAI